jgi:hypothetical protein
VLGKQFSIKSCSYEVKFSLLPKLNHGVLKLLAKGDPAAAPAASLFPELLLQHLVITVIICHASCQ